VNKHFEQLNPLSRWFCAIKPALGVRAPSPNPPLEFECDEPIKLALRSQLFEHSEFGGAERQFYEANSENDWRELLRHFSRKVAKQFCNTLQEY
jgi:hypothetical protein